jgi:hypothetical protein
MSFSQIFTFTYQIQYLYATFSTKWFPQIKDFKWTVLGLSIGQSYEKVWKIISLNYMLGPN